MSRLVTILLFALWEEDGGRDFDEAVMGLKRSCALPTTGLLWEGKAQARAARMKPVPNAGTRGLITDDFVSIDKKCPFTGLVSIRGRILTGTVVSTKMHRTLIIRREYLHFIPKYSRYEKRHKNLAAHVSPAFRVEEGDQVTVGQCRPLSKTVGLRGHWHQAHLLVPRRKAWLTYHRSGSMSSVCFPAPTRPLSRSRSSKCVTGRTDFLWHFWRRLLGG